MRERVQRNTEQQEATSSNTESKHQQHIRDIGTASSNSAHSSDNIQRQLQLTSDFGEPSCSSWNDDSGELQHTSDFEEPSCSSWNDDECEQQINCAIEECTKFVKVTNVPEEWNAEVLLFEINQLLSGATKPVHKFALTCVKDNNNGCYLIEFESKNAAKEASQLIVILMGVVLEFELVKETHLESTAVSGTQFVEILNIPSEWNAEVLLYTINEMFWNINFVEKPHQVARRCFKNNLNYWVELESPKAAKMAADFSINLMGLALKLEHVQEEASLLGDSPSDGLWTESTVKKFLKLLAKLKSTTQIKNWKDSDWANISAELSIPVDKLKSKKNKLYQQHASIVRAGKPTTSWPYFTDVHILKHGSTDKGPKIQYIPAPAVQIAVDENEGDNAASRGKRDRPSTGLRARAGTKNNNKKTLLEMLKKSMESIDTICRAVDRRNLLIEQKLKG
ncbi:NH(3)-dependent NAD(+) synthetase [Frankliniella fusca]|uniref:NH(3)-dependent NAD(+) synthetase n=1 Tax=Frankliniella fusca TaxID=407009 RepID=A0AAE1L9J3_9NEOP|nr:NH(3)-dependent NAD(+) synthetase [Frankliniella fusca]KAK3925643.1 NH(3)-dependent NAD(+) synthetase [Frankliniella fusca]